MNSLIEEIYNTKYVESENGKKVDIFPVSIPYEKGEILYKIIQQTKAKSTLEVGMAYGLSSLFICQAHADKEEGFHTVIDPYEIKRYESIGLLNIKRAGLEKYFEFHEASSYKILPQILNDNKKFDLIFIDGRHLFENVFIDAFYADRLLADEGYLVLDDLWMPSVRKAVGVAISRKDYLFCHDFSEKKNSFQKRLGYFLKDFLQAPFDIFETCSRFHIKTGPIDLAVFRRNFNGVGKND